MKKIIFFLFAVNFALLSCTKKKTDYEAEIGTAIPESGEFREAAIVHSNGFTISIEALNGICYTGYNEIHVRIKNSQTQEEVQPSSLTYLPIYTDEGGNKKSAPHRYQLNYNAALSYFEGYTVFTPETADNSQWDLYFTFTVENQTYVVKHTINVRTQPNKNLNMTSFVGKDLQTYIIALIAPQKPKVGENELRAGIYKLEKPANPPAANFPDPSQFTFQEVSGYTLQIDPRMPEPAMGNHSSPNNKDLRQIADGLYSGIVNYTMTGNWTLNFLFLNPQGQILKGTVVPPDFTPGVEGRKSELFIDILF